MKINTKIITKGEKGMVLPFVMIAILVGALVIPAFLGHAGTSLIGSRNYRNSLDAQYACDAGAEQAIWNLVEGGIDASIPDAGQYTSYNLGETINGLTANVKISNAWEVIAWDDFESGGWTGGGGWINNWTYSGDAAVTSSGIPHKGAYHLRLRSSTGVVSRSVNLSQQISAHLRFWARAESFEPANTAICRVSPDGSTWTTVKPWPQSVAAVFYLYYDFDLNSYGLPAAFYISFVGNMNSTSDFFYVDDLDIAWPATDVKLMADENFESGGWAGGNDWNAAWTHTGASSITTSGITHGGTYHLSIVGPDGYAKRATDLSSQSVAHLQFWAKANAFEGGDKAYCRVSSDGTNWTLVHTWSNTDADNIYRYYDIDLSSYSLTSNFWIAFESGMNRYDDYFYVDDISINAIDAYCITVKADDRILKVAVDLMGGLKNVLCWWFIV
jgi:hypothetical protein